MRLGIIGAGRIGQMHARNLDQTPGVDEVVIIGRDENRTAFRAEAEHLVRLVNHDVENLTPPLAGLGAIQVAQAAATSVRTGRPVDLSPNTLNQRG